VARPLAAALLALATLRYLVPAPGEVGMDRAPAWVRALASAADAQVLPLALGLFVAYLLILRRLAPPPPAERRPTHAPVAPMVVVVVVVVAVVVALLATVRVQRATGLSMLPTLEPRERLLLGHLSSAPAQRGDLVVFRSPGAGAGDDGPWSVRRVVGLPGDRLTFKGGLLTINDWPVPICDAGVYAQMVDGREMSGRLVVEFLDDRAYLTLHRGFGEGLGEYRVKPDELFVVGDNRNLSRDARHWKAGLSVADVVGQPWRIVGAERDGRLDLRRPLRSPGLDLRLTGIDARELARGVERCLRQRPALTRPPGPQGSLAVRAQR
jgi:signal peptidase I